MKSYRCAYPALRHLGDRYFSFRFKNVLIERPHCTAVAVSADRKLGVSARRNASFTSSIASADIPRVVLIMMRYAGACAGTVWSAQTDDC